MSLGWQHEFAYLQKLKGYGALQSVYVTAGGWILDCGITGVGVCTPRLQG